MTSIHPDKGTRSFNIIGYTLLTLITLICLLPFWLMITGSFTSEASIIRDGFPSGRASTAWMRTEAFFRESTKLLALMASR